MGIYISFSSWEVKVVQSGYGCLCFDLKILQEEIMPGHAQNWHSKPYSRVGVKEVVVKVWWRSDVLAGHAGTTVGRGWLYTHQDKALLLLVILMQRMRNDMKKKLCVTATVHVVWKLPSFLHKFLLTLRANPVIKEYWLKLIYLRKWNKNNQRICLVSWWWCQLVKYDTEM